jgi:mannose-6-phosphate isomerase-like protein (cupin superfamily)
MSSEPRVPVAVDPRHLAARVAEPYANMSLAVANDHEVRLSVMTAPFPWHDHPDFDEIFYVLEGVLVIEFDNAVVELAPGQLLTVPAGVRHRTRPAGARSVNLTIERRSAATRFD